MKPSEAYEYASQWGSYMTSVDPGACMYGFDSDCRPQDEQHRDNVITYMGKMRLRILDDPSMFDSDELEQMDSFIEFITKMEIEGEKLDHRLLTNENGCDILYRDIISACNGENYTLSVVGDDMDTLEYVVNMGIDSHLEAADGKFTHKERKVGKRVLCYALDGSIDPESLCVIIRRLYDLPWCDSEDCRGDDCHGSRGVSLASSILMTLGFDECGEQVGREALGLE